MNRLLLHRNTHLAFLAFLLLSLVFFVPPANELRQRLQFIIFDTYLKEHPRESNHDVVVIDIDDESLDQLGQWPWPRTMLGAMIENINKAGAKVVAFDGVLAEADRTSPHRILGSIDAEAAREIKNNYDEFLKDNDAELAEIIKEQGNFVAGFTHGNKAESPIVKRDFLSKKEVRQHFLYNGFQFRNVAAFLPELQKASDGNGSFMADPEIDNVIRKTPHIFSDSTKLYPSLSLELVRLAEGDGKNTPKIKINPEFSRLEQNTYFIIEIGEKKIPIDIEGKVWIHYKDFYRTKDKYYFSAAPFIENDDKRTLPDLSGKYVMIASSAEGLKDLRATPQGLLPGVEVHLNAAEQILNDDYLLRPLIVLDFEHYTILVFGLLIIILQFFVGAAFIAGLTVLSVGGFFGFSYWSFLENGILVDPVYPSLSIILIFVLSTFFNYLRSEVQRRQVKDAFGLYISPDFMKELTSSPDKLKLGGENKELSVMFSDIRSFTTISEGLTPEELIQLMNDFLTPMSDIIMRNKGTIDKYMGDAIMAFWNAPLDDEGHARHACLSALQMQKSLEPINEEIEKRSKEKGVEPVVLAAGIGINTGACSVGNMGSRQRFAYSALGDAVNLASRLEGQTKDYGVEILIGETTHAQVPDMATLELDLITVKGKTEPVRIYTLLGDEEYAQSESFVKLKDKQDQILKAYRGQNFDEAMKLIREGRALAEGSLNKYYDMLGGRIVAMMQKPPKPDWDGVFVATSK